jgi:hypothetical protein
MNYYSSQWDTIMSYIESCGLWSLHVHYLSHGIDLHLDNLEKKEIQRFLNPNFSPENG